VLPFVAICSSLIFVRCFCIARTSHLLRQFRRVLDTQRAQKVPVKQVCYFGDRTLGHALCAFELYRSAMACGGRSERRRSFAAKKFLADGDKMLN
jgi:hypothetical protein